MVSRGLIVVPHLASRILYGARDKNNERHWRSSLGEINQLIERGFAPAPLASGI
jgi:hypothetical protein